MMTLDTYLRETPETNRAFAERTGLTPVSVSRLRHGHHWPTGRTAFKIWKATDGKVGFIPSDPDVAP